MGTETHGSRSTTRKFNFTTTAPGASDDSSAGYAVNSEWYDTTGAKLYVCTDASVGAAVWTSIGGSTLSAVYASVHGEEIAWTQAATQNTWYEISDSDINDSQLSGITHDGSGKLTVPNTGYYHIVYNVTLETSAANHHIETAISVDGTEQTPGQSHFETFANQEEACSGSAILSLTASQTIEISVRTTTTGTPTITVDDICLTVMQIAAPAYSLSLAPAWPVGSVFISVVSTNPATLLGFGTWSAFGAGRVMVGLDSGDTDFDTAEETGGAKTVASSAQTFAGNALATHQHAAVSAGTPAGSNAAEATHTHSVTSNVTVADHASHTHTYTEVPNHVHVQNFPSSFSGGSAYMGTDTSVSGSTASYLSTANPTGGVATGTTAGPSATLTHTPTNNAVTSGAGSSHNHAFTGTEMGTHQHDAITAGTPSGTNTPGAATSVVQPYIVVYMWKRTA